jgi:hypothetical protein
VLNATGGVFEGNITADTGEIAGWKIGSFTDGADTYTGSLYRDAGKYRIFLRSDYNATTDAAIGIKEYETADKSDKGTYSFIVSHEGKLRATGVNITGIINATSGYIGNWELTATSLTNGTKNTNGFIGLYNDSGYKLIIGSKFKVDENGNLECTGGTFSGSITGASGTFSGKISATTGSIGGWNINSTEIFRTTTGPSYGRTVSLTDWGIELESGGTSQYYSTGASWENIAYVGNKASNISSWINNGKSGTFYVYSPDNTYGLNHPTRNSL